MSTSRAIALAGLGGLAFTGAPAVTAIGPLRRRVAGRLSGIGPSPHIALTFDDGPDPASTPAFLDLLERHQQRATFFVLGAFVSRNTALLRRMVADGHEVAVHGWTHRCTIAFPPTALQASLRAARERVEDITSSRVRWYRPPYGVLSTESVLACREQGLEPVLWTAWGREWERAATPDRITASVLRTLRPGGTILLHDTDRHSPRGSWRRTLAATAALLDGPLAAATLGPLGDHWDTVPCEDHVV